MLTEIKRFLDEVSGDLIMYAPNRDQSDYRCRFCGVHTVTNIDFTVHHLPSCLGIQAKKLSDKLSNAGVD